nr:MULTISPECIES: GFA family protein [unclassified Methylocystis]
MPQEQRGTGHSSHLAVPGASVTISGDVTVYDKPADSGHVVSRAFCPRCGAPIYSLNDAMPDLIFLRASSLDDLEVFKPQMIVYASRGASWDISDTNLPRFEKMPPMMKG